MKRVHDIEIAAGLMFLITMCVAAGGADTQPAGAAPTARGVIEKVTHDALAVLRDAAITKVERNHKVRQIAFDTMDFDVLARLSLGSYWRDLSDTQRASFVEEFRRHVANTYGHTTDEYTDEDIAVTADHEEVRGDWSVQTTITGTRDGRKQEVAKVDYRLRQKEGQWKIIDVTIDGVSLMANFRSQFKEIMENGGFDKLVKLLKDKNAAAEK